MPISPYLPIVVVGTLRRDFVIPPGGKPLNDIPGGHLLHTAVHLHHWENRIGLISRIGPDLPQEWLDHLTELGMDVHGIKRTALPIEHRFFIRYDGNYQKSTLYPLAQYANEGLPFPKELLGYNVQTNKIDSMNAKTDETIIARDIPENYLESTFIHLCPMDYMTHNLLTQHFAQFGPKRITLRAGKGYMVPQFWHAIPLLVNSLTAFITSISSLKSLFSETRETDIWKMAKIISEWGPEYVIIEQDNFSNLLWDRNHQSRYRLGPYQNKVVNLIGIHDAFCGGFIGELKKTYDPVKALIAGNVASSIAMEANHPFYALDTIPGLHEARADYLYSKLELL